MIQKIVQLARNAQIAARLAGFKYACQSIIHTNIDLKVTSKPFDENDSVIVLAPHPDDEVIGCGGALALASKASARIGVVYITNGAHGTPSGKRDDKLIDTRRHEALAGLKMIDKKIRTRFLQNDDGNYHANKKCARQIAGLINGETGTINIFTPWFFDDHSDHAEVTKTLPIILKMIDKSKKIKIWQYEIWSPLVPNTILPIDEVIDKKISAINAHRSQLKSRNYDKAILGLNNYRGCINNSSTAESYFVSSASEFLKLIS